MSDFSCIFYFVPQILALNPFQRTFGPAHTSPTPARVPRVALLLMSHQHRGKNRQSMERPSHTSNPPLRGEVLLEVPWGLCRASPTSTKPCIESREGRPRGCVGFFCELGEYLDLGHICEAWHHLSKEDLLTIYLRLDT